MYRVSRYGFSGHQPNPAVDCKGRRIGQSRVRSSIMSHSCTCLRSVLIPGLYPPAVWTWSKPDSLVRQVSGEGHAIVLTRLICAVIDAFKATTNEIVSSAKGIYDQVRSWVSIQRRLASRLIGYLILYDQRVGHLLPNKVVKRVIEQIYELKDVSLFSFHL